TLHRWLRPRLRHSRFLLARRRARLISPRRFPIRTRRMRCSWACHFPQAWASSLSPRRAAQTSHGWQFSELRKFRAVFRDRRDVGQGGGFIGMVGSAEPAVLVTLPMGNYTAIVRGVGAMPTGLALLEIYPQ